MAAMIKVGRMYKTVFEASILLPAYSGSHAVVGAEDNGNGVGRWYIKRNEKTVYVSGPMSVRTALRLAESRTK